MSLTQETLWIFTASLKDVKEITTSTGLDKNQEIHIQESFTSMETETINAIRALRKIPIHSLIYNLPNISLTDAGTYYCAVAMCGEILFGNGSRINIGGEKIIYIRYIKSF